MNALYLHPKRSKIHASQILRHNSGCDSLPLIITLWAV